MSLVVESGRLEQVDRRADNPHRNIPVTKPVREAKARLWAVAPLMMMTGWSYEGKQSEICMFLQNAGIYLRVHTVSQPRRTMSTRWTKFILPEVPEPKIISIMTTLPLKSQHTYVHWYLGHTYLRYDQLTFILQPAPPTFYYKTVL
jgi:hypothetical protein